MIASTALTLSQIDRGWPLGGVNLPQQTFETIFRWVVTLLALRMVWLTVMDQLG